MGNLSLPDGTPTGGVYGFASMAVEILGKLKPDYVAVAWDKAGTNIRKRREMYAEYKANRKKAPEDFYAQIPILMGLLAAFGWPMFEADDFEADDIMGTLARQAAGEGVEVDLVSGDLDMLQIVGRNIKMYQLKRGFSDVEKFDVEAVEKKYGLKQEQFLDLKALKGDSSDNIPGVPGIGEKTAVELLREYESFEGVYAHLAEIRPAVAKKLEVGRGLGEVSKRLAEIQFDAPVKFSEVPEVRADFGAVEAEFKKLEFRSLIKKLSELCEAKMSSSQSSAGRPSSISLAAEEGGETLKKEIRKVSSDKVPKNLFVAWDVKGEWHEEGRSVEDLPKKIYDVQQAEFLLNPLRRAREAPEAEEVAEIYEEQQEKFGELPKLKWVAEELDFPLIPILYKMEVAGVELDAAYLAEMGEKMGEEIAEIEQNIYKIAQHPFNINSPIQLSQVLYEELGLPTKGVKRKLRAYSTSQKELDKLWRLHPIIGEIERIRELSKLKSTYVDALPKLADSEGRVHTTFTQNVTATGRLSSVNPNLQNIPVRTEIGREIRKGFIAGEGKVLVSADYSQFELRLAAVLAGDEQLVADFNAGLDIHTKTASDVYHIPMDEVTKEQRRAAKTINFGVLYGMSAKGLSDATGMYIGKAKEFIDQYFEVRKKIREYLDSILEQARTLGYVETYFGRRRPTPDVHSANFVVRAGAERAAMNMPIQGTEADLMKLAMVKVDKELGRFADARLILQVHDSLMVECAESEAPHVARVLKEVMEGVAPELAVRLDVEVSTGKNWGEL
jgi:DNA polymerase-1